MRSFVPGPRYAEMLQGRPRPTDGEFDPANLFNITWRAADGAVRCLVLPKQLTGVRANILLLAGKDFPSGSHKVGPAYATLMEAELAGEIEPGANTIIGPSTGNFGIGTAYIARLKGYSAVVVMPEGMSAERYERIRQYGAELDLTPGSESDVILVLERTEQYKKDPRNKVLAQFELLPNYRFHRYVTGRSAIEAAAKHGNGRIALFVSAPGSAGTLAAGDEIKARYTDALVCAVEPRECSTLFNNGCGTHAIEGIGDKMVSLIHNVLTTDYVTLVHDQDCIEGLDLLECRQSLLQQLLSAAPGTLDHLRGELGISAICNVLAAIRMARFLDLGREDNVVTIATDGFDRYPSVLAALDKRRGLVGETQLAGTFERIFRVSEASEILDLRSGDQKQRLFGYKQDLWSRFGYTEAYLEGMKSQSFWDAEFERIHKIDAMLRQ